MRSAIQIQLAKNKRAPHTTGEKSCPPQHKKILVSQRVISSWNSLPSVIVNSESINMKIELDHNPKNSKAIA